MASGTKFPIRLKLFLLLAGVALCATSTYLALAVKMFKQDKMELVYELNASNVKTLSARIEATLSRMADKAKLLTQGHMNQEWSKAVMASEPELISYSLFTPDGADAWKESVSVRKADYLKMYGMAAESLTKIRAQVPIPFARILALKTLAWNSTTENGAPILSIGLAIEVDGAGTTNVAVIDTRADGLLDLVSQKGLASIYVTDAVATVVAHSDPILISGRASLAEVPIVRDALDSRSGFEVKRFLWKDSSWIGAFAPVRLGNLWVISQVEESVAFGAASRLVWKSILFGLLVITLGLIVSGWISGGLTRPLQALVDAAERLAHWDSNDSLNIKSRDEIGVLARAFGSMSEELRKSHAALEVHRDELEQKVKERTAELEHEKRAAAEAQDSLIRTTRLAALGELAGAAAHEILNPVNNLSIRLERSREQLDLREKQDFKILQEITKGWKNAYSEGGIEALQKELSKNANDGRPLVEEDLDNLEGIARDSVERIKQRDEDAEFVQKEIVKITKLINNMRSLSRVEGERKRMDIGLAIDDTVLALSDLMKKNNAEVIVELPPGKCDVIADKDELVQVFSNLLRNGLQAIQQAERRAGELRISRKAEGGRIEIRIADNGSGIASDNISKLFEANFTTKPVESGTGLGLSISRRLVRAFGGDIELEKTVEGEGTTFLVWLPEAPKEMEQTGV
jgi:signal transduction histidine kinase